MRKLVLVSIFTFCAIIAGLSTVSAQWYAGPTAGLNVSNISSNDPTPGLTVSSNIAFNGGITVRKQFSKYFSAQSDVLYSIMGAKKTVSVDGFDDVVTDATLNYLQIPLYVNFEMPFQPDNLVPYRVKKSFVSGHLHAGGYFGYGLDGSNDVFNAIDFGILVGGGFSFKMDPDDKKRLTIGGRYLIGMSDYNKTDEIKETHSALQANIGFVYKLTNRRYIRYSR